MYHSYMDIYGETIPISSAAIGGCIVGSSFIGTADVLKGIGVGMGVGGILGASYLVINIPFNEMNNKET